jgi:putative membrane protein
LWGGIVNETRNLARLATVHLEATPERRNDVVLSAVAFAYASMHILRQSPRTTDPVELLGPLGKALSPEEFDVLANAEHLPLAIATRITSQLRNARDQGLLSDIVLTSLDQNVQLLMDYIGACERIHKTPIPYAYMVHVRRALIMYCGSLPFALVKDFGWTTVPVVVLLAYVFLGIEEIGVEIEDPFGEDDNDLPLERICGTIERNLLKLISLPAPSEMADE